MDDWQVGDLALRAGAGNWEHIDGCARSVPAVGHIAQVDDVYVSFGVQWLGLVGWPDGDYDARAFRKIRPHTPDAEDAETIRLLNGKPATVPA